MSKTHENQIGYKMKNALFRKISKPIDRIQPPRKKKKIKSL